MTYNKPPILSKRISGMISLISDGEKLDFNESLLGNYRKQLQLLVQARNRIKYTREIRLSSNVSIGNKGVNN